MNRFPHWFRQDLPESSLLEKRLNLFKDLGLNTVCQSAHCPNIGRCFSQGCATFLILGNTCTRNCRFCCVKKGSPLGLDLNEPNNLVKAVEAMNSDYVVITSVCRDDLPDGGAGQFFACVNQLRSRSKNLRIELLIPDFKGNRKYLELIVNSKPDIIGHNLETVSRLYQKVRPQADYNVSLKILRWIKEINPAIFTKSAILVGLGEDLEEVTRLMQDLRSVNCDILTIGQYLAPSKDHLPVCRFVMPEEFEEMKKIGISLGFRGINSAPKARSSFMAEETFAGLYSVKDGDL